jgi:hypothetical protein
VSGGYAALKQVGTEVEARASKKEKVKKRSIKNTDVVRQKERYRLSSPPEESSSRQTPLNKERKTLLIFAGFPLRLLNVL